MELKEITIKNYRSIADMEIYPEPTCQAFVGINESGKSNILNAISLLSPEKNLNKDDARIEGADES
ncbi:AAA family ATPase, partial [Synergistaceae bacterium OttesenSCG-928-I11]|nr:AAA family ATPase [Synergistaceae bacterium OttesenSCG-928-I11]